jgi:hypothetical protein
VVLWFRKQQELPAARDMTKEELLRIVQLMFW